MTQHTPPPAPKRPATPIIMTAARVELYARVLMEFKLRRSEETRKSFAQYLATMLFLGHIEEGVLDDSIALRGCLGGWLVRREQYSEAIIVLLRACADLRCDHTGWRELVRVTWSLADQVEYDCNLFPCGTLTEGTLQRGSRWAARVCRRDQRVHAVSRTSMLPGIAKEGEVGMDDLPELGAYDTERALSLRSWEKFLRAAQAQNPNVKWWVESKVNGVAVDELAREEGVCSKTMYRRIRDASLFLGDFVGKEGAQ